MKNSFGSLSFSISLANNFFPDIWPLWPREKGRIGQRRGIYCSLSFQCTSLDLLATNIQTFFLIKLEEMAMALDQLMGEGGTKLTVANRCQGNWKKNWCFCWTWSIAEKWSIGVFYDDQFYRFSKKNSSAPRLSAVLFNLGLDDGDVLDRENWVKRCQNILQPEWFLLNWICPTPRCKNNKIEDGIGVLL